jgi:D-alanine transaminase
MQTLANLNGQIMPLAEVKISPLDRGFLFGDAVYEVLRVYQGRPWLEQEHFDRLARSLEEIRISGIDVGRLRRRMHETIRSGGFGESTVYLQVTRGAAPRRHAFPTNAVPLELLWVDEYTGYYTEPCRTGCRVITYPDLRWHRCDIKSTNLLGNVLANQAAVQAGCSEAFLHLPDGTLTEASHSTFFAVQGGKLHTTPLKANVLPSITRGHALRLAQQGKIEVVERYLHLRELAEVDELFLVGTTCEILPVVQVDGRSVKSGEPGPVTRRLQSLYTESVQAFLRQPPVAD